MLKSLISRVKSQKSQSQHSQKGEEIPQPAKHLQTLKPIPEYKYIPLTEVTVIDCNINKIRYSVLQNSPDIYNKVLACPISNFNKLAYAKRKVKQIDLKHSPFPEYLNYLKPMLQQQLPTFNHLLINVYPPGIGIMPHFDGPAYKSKVIVLSLGGPAIISFADNYSNINKLARLLLENQSIHIFQDEAYQTFLHGIQDFALESIFFKLVQIKQGLFMAENASVANFYQTNLCKYILQKLNSSKLIFPLKQQIDLSVQLGSKCCLIPIEENATYNCKIQIFRQQRISITIRQKLE